MFRNLRILATTLESDLIEGYIWAGVSFHRIKAHCERFPDVRGNEIDFIEKYCKHHHLEGDHFMQNEAKTDSYFLVALHFKEFLIKLTEVTTHFLKTYALSMLCKTCKR